MPLTQALAYVRASGKAQADGDGPERQRQAITRFAKRSRITVVEEYSDLGVSGGTELAGRPGLAKLLDRLESNGITTVIIERADRLARDLLVQEVLVGQFAKVGARILTADRAELTATDDPTRRLIRRVLGAVAEFEKNVLVLKLRAARERIAPEASASREHVLTGTHPPSALSSSACASFVASRRRDAGHHWCRSPRN